MTHKEKAISLINQFGNICIGETEDGKPYLLSSESLRESKQCALICIEEMIKLNGEYYTSREMKSTEFYRKKNAYLFEVKKELENA